MTTKYVFQWFALAAISCCFAITALLLAGIISWLVNLVADYAGCICRLAP
jgi:hypothetical protein